MLEDVFQVDTASSLWSSEALIKHPDDVIEAHLMFLRAGARLIATASLVTFRVTLTRTWLVNPYSQ